MVYQRPLGPHMLLKSLLQMSDRPFNIAGITSGTIYFIHNIILKHLGNNIAFKVSFYRHAMKLAFPVILV